MNLEEYRRYLRAEVKRHTSQKALAQALGVSEQYLSEILRGSRTPSDNFLMKTGHRWVRSIEPMDQHPGTHSA